MVRLEAWQAFPLATPRRRPSPLPNHCKRIDTLLWITSNERWGDQIVFWRTEEKAGKRGKAFSELDSPYIAAVEVSTAHVAQARSTVTGFYVAHSGALHSFLIMTSHDGSVPREKGVTT
jgi:hypothetical protein